MANNQADRLNTILPRPGSDRGTTPVPSPTERRKRAHTARCLQTLLALGFVSAATVKADPPSARPAPASQPDRGAPDPSPGPERTSTDPLPEATLKSIREVCEPLRPLMRAEYHMIVRVCQPTDEQRKSLADAAEQALWSTSKWFVLRDSDSSETSTDSSERELQVPDPRDRIEADLAAAVRTHLSASQQTRFNKALSERAAFRKTATLNEMVAVLEVKLALNLRTCERLREALLKNWDTDWIETIEVYEYCHDSSSFPLIPDEIVLPLLNAEQRPLWDRLREPLRGRPSFPAFLYTCDENNTIEAPELDAAEADLDRSGRLSPVKRR